jgi:chaperonin GroEL
MAKDITFDLAAREALLRGAKTLSDAVGSTLGPKGSNVAIAREYGPPIVIHDGIGVAREIILKDPNEAIGCELLKEASAKTNDNAGDGTTTAAVLGYAIAAEAHKNIVAGASAMRLRIGIEKAVAAMTKELDDIAIPVKGEAELLQVATISAQNEEIGKIVTEGISRMGTDGVLAVEESQTTSTYLEIKEGMDFNRGWLAPHFVTNPELGECVLERPYVLVTDIKLSSVADAQPFLQKFANAIQEHAVENPNILVIGEDITGDALALMIVNKLKGVFNVCAVKAPGFGDKQKDMLRDIAVVTGAKYFSTEAGDKLTEEGFDIEDLGRAEKVTATEKNTVIIGGEGATEAIASRVQELKNANEKAETDFDHDKLQERIARLTSGIGIVFVGASTEAEMRERKERFIDAISATRAAMAEGIVPGGETALIRASKALDTLKESGDVQLGIDLVRRASVQPFKKLMENAGYDSGKMLGELEAVLKKENFGIDVIDASPKNMVKSGIIDPVKVTKSALENAASCAVMMLTTSVLVAEEPKKERYEQ